MVFQYWKQLLLMLLTAALCSGCTAVGALIQQTTGPARVDAKYQLPKQSTLILVEKRRNPAAGEFDSDEVAHAIAAELKEHDVAPTVDLDKLAALKDVDPDKFRKIPVPALARALLAKQVIYVDLAEFAVESDTSQLSIHGKAKVFVKVIDADTGQTAWPLDTSEGYEIDDEIPYTSDTDVNTLTAMHSTMIANLADSIAKLFYKWQPETAREGGAAD